MYGLISLALLVLAAGCATVGPDRMVQDRFNYSNAIGTSFKEQVLLNIVKLRYMDMPIILQVGSIISSYTLEGSATVAGNVQFGGTDSLIPGVSGSYSQTPTITYNQVTGKAFVDMVLTPVRPSAFMYLIEGDWRADHIFVTLIDQINGYSNQSRARAGAMDDAFARIAELFLTLQKAGAMAARIDRSGKSEKFYLKLVNPRKDPDVQKTIQEFQNILGLDADIDSYHVIFGYVTPNDHTIAMKTRSTMQIMTEYASFVSVPEEHLANGSAASYDDMSAAGYIPVTIPSGPSRPSGEVFAAVKYNNSWYWIDHNDYETKRSIHVLMMLFSISESGASPNQPVITVPTR